MNACVSIIVPVYNVEIYLEKCLQSIINQSYKNIEIILVDDGSTDVSGQICDDYAKKDHRIKVIHQKNSGLSAARNTGTVAAIGQYITYIDSDDYISCDYIETLYSLIEKKHADISICRFRYVYGIDEEDTDGKDATFIYNKEEALKVLLSEKEFGHYTHQKMFKKEIVQKYPFPEGKIYEDIATTYLYFSEANMVAYTQRQLYFYRQRPGSIITGAYDKKSKFDVLNTLDKMQYYFDVNYPDIAEYVLVPKMFYYLHTFARLPENKTLYPEERKRIKQFIINNRFKSLRFNDMPKSTKKKILLSFMGEKIYRKVWSIQKYQLEKRIKIN